MNEEVHSWFVGFFIGCAISGFFASLITNAITNRSWESESVARGYANYVMTSASPRAEWHWKDEK